MAPFVREQHLIQNLGDGTFYHSGSLAIRASVAAGSTITYNLLHNGAVAMTGGQQAVGRMPIPEIVAELLAEGVTRVVVEEHKQLVAEQRTVASTGALCRHVPAPWPALAGATCQRPSRRRHLPSRSPVRGEWLPGWDQTIEARWSVCTSRASRCVGEQSRDESFRNRPIAMSQTVVNSDHLPRYADLPR